MSSAGGSQKKRKPGVRNESADTQECVVPAEQVGRGHGREASDERERES